MRRAILILSVMLLVGCIIAQPTSGKCGKNVKWTLQDDGTLVVEGTGDTHDYSKKPQNSPFVKNGIADRIKVVDLSHFHTDGHLSENLFYGCRFLEKIILRQSQNKMLSNNIFSECAHLTIIEYANNTNYSSKSQNNYYKIVQNTMNVGIPTVTKCIVSDTSKREEDLFKPLEPFPPIESFDNLKEEKFSDKYGEGIIIGQWSNNNWNGVVKKIYTSKPSWNISLYENGENIIYDRQKKGKSSYSGSWREEGYIIEERRNINNIRFFQIDYYNSKSKLYLIHLFENNSNYWTHEKYFTNNGDIFINKIIDRDKYGGLQKGHGEYHWANGNRYCGTVSGGSGREQSALFYQSGKGIFYNNESGELHCGLWKDNNYLGSPEIISLQDFWDTPVNFFPFNAIAKFHIEKEINEWQKKGEFESTAEWQTRVTESTRQQKANELYMQLQNDYIENYAKKINLELELDRYDADNRTYLITDTVFGSMIVSVENITPQAFKSSWNKIIPVPTYFINGNNIDILEMDFMLYDSVSQQYRRVARYQKTAELTYQLADIKYNFEPFTLPQGEQHKSNGKVNQPIYIPYTSSDVDINIPVVNKRNDNTFVFIIANENYSAVAKVPFALNDGNTFKEYCVKTLGVDEKRVILYKDATFGHMTECVERMKQVGEAYKEEANIIFYYAGHAFPDEANRTRHLLPVDGNSRITSTTYSLKNLYSELGNLPVKTVICFIDACFSGATREDGMLLTGRGVILTPKEDVLKGNLVVFTATDSSETAHQYVDKGHGLFTYYLLKKLQDTKGDVTFEDLTNYVIDNVRKTSVEVNMKLQTPTVKVSPAMKTKWQDKKLNE